VDEPPVAEMGEAEPPVQPAEPMPGPEIGGGVDPVAPTAAAQDSAVPAARRLFDGQEFGDWKRTEYGGEGEVEIEDGAFLFRQGVDLTGVHWTGDPLPKVNYDLSLEAQKVDGSDFFCGVIFPVGDSHCSLIVGGWGGGVVGLSAVDGQYANENQTASHASFETGKWYRIRLQVSDAAVRAWIDGKNVVDQTRVDHTFSLHPAVDLAKPFGLCAYQTVAKLRNIRLRPLTESEQQGGPPADEPKTPPTGG
jgi:hypothetical protein